MLPDVQAQNGNALHISDALHGISCIRLLVSQHTCRPAFTLLVHINCSLQAIPPIVPLHGCTVDTAAMKLSF